MHALSNVCHVDVERVSKRKPGEVVYLYFAPTAIYFVAYNVLGMIASVI